MNQLRHCRMCGRTILPVELANHPRCDACSILLEPELDQKTLCRCGKYHNAQSLQDKHYCRPCMGEEVPTGTPIGEPVRISAEDDYD